MSTHVPSTQLPGRWFWLSARGATINVFTTEVSRGRQRRANVARVGTGSPLAPRRGAQPSYDTDVQPAPLPRLKVRVASVRVASTRWALSAAHSGLPQATRRLSPDLATRDDVSPK